MLTKVAPRRGPKQAPWVNWLYPLIVDEFDRYRKMGVKFSPKLLVCLAKDILVEMNHLDFPPNLQHKGTTIIDRIDIRWIQRFQTVNNIDGRAQIGKLMLSPTRQQRIDKKIAFHLGQLAREFRAGTLDENLVENIDETHCKVNLDNGKTLGFRGDNDVKYTDVVSGGMGMTLMIRQTGEPHARIYNPCVIFQNISESYPIRGVPDDVPGVCYRTTKKSFITQKLWAQYLQEPRAHYHEHATDRSKQRVIFVDNFNGHHDDGNGNMHAALESNNATICYLVAAATDKIQSCDSFVILKIKDAYMEIWDDYKFKAIKDGLWREGSSALQNPGKLVFMRMAAEAVHWVNKQRNQTGLTYARKAMIRCELSFDITREWHEKQLNCDLQIIIEKHRPHFESLAVPDLDRHDDDTPLRN